jgi:hypothetical protein
MMQNPLVRSLLAAALAAAVVVALAYLGLTRALGAHPFWETRVAWIGAPIGVVAFFVLSAFKLGRPTVISGFALITIFSISLAYYGKTAFAASYAEDRLAGYFWYFAWIATCAGATATLAAIARKSRS